MKRKHHGLRKHPLYSTWASIKTRTTNSNSSSYKTYGAKGVRMCEQWFDDFERFLRDVGEKPSPEHTLDRFPDRNGNYEPGNVRWANRSEQAANKDSTRLVVVGGTEVSLPEYASMRGVRYFSLRGRIIRTGESPEEAANYLLRYGDRPRLCTNGCDRAIYSRGVCNRCYQKLMRKVKPIRSDNSSGVRGVSWHKASGKWCARVQRKGVRLTLGFFDSIESAKQAIDSYKESGNDFQR